MFVLITCLQAHLYKVLPTATHFFVVLRGSMFRLILLNVFFEFTLKNSCLMLLVDKSTDSHITVQLFAFISVYIIYILKELYWNQMKYIIKVDYELLWF